MAHKKAGGSTRNGRVVQVEGLELKNLVVNQLYPEIL